MTLRDVGMRSGGRLKPTAVAAYERSDRNISLERFCELSAVYGMAPERLLLQIMWRVAGRPEPRIDDGRLAELPKEERVAVGEFLRQARRMRGDGGERTIALRIRDLEFLATASGDRLDEFLECLRPALARSKARRVARSSLVTRRLLDALGCPFKCH